MTALPHANDLALELDRAIERSELVIRYQPKISLLSGALVGVEALMRWQSRRFGTVDPSMFIPNAERSGAINELSEWGLRTVLRQWRDWSNQGIRTDIAFNISAPSLRDHAQGFFISEPLKGSELVPWMLGAAAEWRARLSADGRSGGSRRAVELPRHC